MSNQESLLIDAIFNLSRLMKDNAAYNPNIIHLSMLQVQALVFLKKHKQSQMGEIAQNFKIELSSATSLVNKLTKAKLTQRKTDKKDRRLVIISLTPKGEELLKQTMEEKIKMIKANLVTLTQKDKDDLLRITNKMVEKMEKQHEK